MPTTRHSRHGSLQYWPRKRAKRQHARIRTMHSDKPGLQAFAGFKAGMTHVMVIDNAKNSPTKGQEIRVPVTIIECPPLRVAGVRFYKKNLKGYGETAATEVKFKPTKDLERTTKWSETGSLDKIDPANYTRATLILHTQPSLSATGQKKPHIFESQFNGSVEDTIAFAKENKELPADQVLTPGQFIDVHAVTTGKGYQGVVKRFGVSLRSHKSEKSARKAVIGPEGYGKVQFTAPMAGKMGYHQRTEYNKRVLGIMDAQDVQISGGIVGYGNTKTTTILVEGSVPGPKRRMITMTHASRPDDTKSEQPPEITHVATRSQQGNQ